MLRLVLLTVVCLLVVVEGRWRPGLRPYRRRQVPISREEFENLKKRVDQLELLIDIVSALQTDVENLTARLDAHDKNPDPDPVPCTGEGFLLVSDTYCVRPFNISVDYGTAESICEDNEASLFRPKNLTDVDVLNAIIIDSSLSVSLWIGADDMDNEGNFVYSDGDPLPIDSPLWAMDQPNGGPNENCVSFTGPSPPLADVDCSQLFNFVCQKN